ncbi:MAG: hypothetical protein IBJ14_14125 [Hydrogenophaga sp.]|nr:hypothetical protein [Hydrogenophaga sp.]
MVRILLSSALALAPSALTVAALNLLLGGNWREPVVETLLNTHLPWLTAAGSWIKARGEWAPNVLVWAAWTLTIFQFWSERVVFFAVSSQRFDAMKSVSDLAWAPGIISWVEAPTDASAQSFDPQDGWQRQRRALEALRLWIDTGAADGYWGHVWPRKPAPHRTTDWQPLSFALLTGANGVGKSSMALHFSKQISWGTDLSDSTVPRKMAWHDWLSAWSRTVLPWRRRRAGDPWDVGVLVPHDQAMVEALRHWEPRRPTLLLIDEPSSAATECLKILEARRHVFWHPVRVLLLDQSLPLALDPYIDSSALTSPAVVLTHGGALDLGELKFDAAAVRSMWNALCGHGSERPEDSATARKLWASDEVDLAVAVSQGNPLQVALLLDQLRRTPLSLEQWVAKACHIARAPSSVALLELEHKEVRHRLVADRARDLVDTHLGTMQRLDPSLPAMLMPALVAATVTAGLRLDDETAARVDARALNELFPSRRRVADPVWVPPVRPTIVARAFLADWIGRVAAPQARALEVARLAWRLEPEGALRGMHDRSVLPDDLQAAMREVRRTRTDQRLSLPLAQSDCIAVLCDRASTDDAVESVRALNLDDREQLLRWLRRRMEDRDRRVPEPLGAVLLALRFVAWTLSMPLVEDKEGALAWGLAQVVRWAPAMGTIQFPFARERELADALDAFLLATLPYWGDGRPQELDSWRRQMRGVGGHPALRACRRLIRESRRVESASPEAGEPATATTIASHWRLTTAFAALRAGQRGLEVASQLANRVECLATLRPEFAEHADLQKERARTWGYVIYAAARLGGERALEESRLLAERVDAIATSQPEFAAHAGLQKERAEAWGYVTYAASQLGGERALKESRSLADRVETIATLQSEFAAHTGLQEEHATAWRFVTYAASELGGERALKESRSLAERVDAIATSQPEFAAHAGLQKERTEAWRCVTYAASELGGDQALEKSRSLAERVDAIATSQPEFAAHAGLQRERAEAWRCVTYAASQLGGERALMESRSLAERLDAIATSQPEFAAHAGLQEEHATAWRFVTYAASQLGGERALKESRSLADRVETIATSQPEFAAHARLQDERVTAWRCVTYAASKLGGERALEESRLLAERVDAIATSQPEFAVHAGLQEARTTAWRCVTYAASELGGERALEESLLLADRVDAIATSQPEFAVHAGLQEERAKAWRFVTYAASQLGGERALKESRSLSDRVETIATSQPEFAAHARLQDERATAWRCVTYAASKLGGERALEESRLLAERVDAIATSQPEFAVHAGLQEARATAWRCVTYAAAQLSGERALEECRSLAARVESIVTSQPEFAAHAGLQNQCSYAWTFVADRARAENEVQVEQQARVRASRRS